MKDSKAETFEESWQELWDRAYERHGGRISIRPKYSLKFWWKVLAILHKIITLGRGPDMLEHFFTTGMGTIWTPGDGSQWEQMSAYSKRSLLSHEIDHMDLEYFGDHDARSKDPSTLRRRNLFSRLWHGFKYLWGCPLPFKYANYRAQVEMWGYQRNADQYAATHGGKVSLPMKEHIYKQFSSASYGWMATPETAKKIVKEIVSIAQDKYDRGELDHLKNLK